MPFTPVQDHSAANKTASSSRFGDLVDAAIARGSDVRMLVWTNVLEKEQNVAMRDRTNAACPTPTHAGPARFVFDDRLPHTTSSHHQKSLIVRRGRSLATYLGGIDLTNDRWDTATHDNAALREQTGIKKDHDGWLDAHCKLEGPAALDVAANFVARWNGQPQPSTNDDLVDVVLRFSNPEFGPLPRINEPYPGEEAHPIDVQQQSGSHAVQVLRTFSPECGELYASFAPRGEQPIFHARIKAIRNARNYIYIEDQYFILVPELLDELMRVLPRLQRVIVVVNRTTQPTLTGYAKYKFDVVEPLQRAFPGKFRLYTTRASRKLYVHTKLVIIDDVYVSLGSANWNRRSMTSDSELACSVIDAEHVENADGITAGKLALAFRLGKFAEVSAIPRDNLAKMPLLAACDAIDAAARDARATSLCVIEPYSIEDEKARFFVVPDAVRKVVDPDPDPDSPAKI